MKGWAFDAVTVLRVFSLDRYCRGEPETPAAEVLTEDEREGIGIVVGGEPLPGNEVLWRAYVQLKAMVRVDASS